MKAKEKHSYKEMTGTVVSDRMDKTRIVKVARQTTHPVFNKTIKRANKFMAHDEKNAAKMGDVVKIKERRPLSKQKRWMIVEVIEKAK